MKSGIRIEKVAPESRAAQLSMKPGDRVLAVNGQLVRDVIDFGYYSADEELLFKIEKTGGDVREVFLSREEGEPLGILFEAPKPRSCSNSCLFCFVDQLPNDLRSSLYVKDEDYRLSFLYGNFITLSSLRREEVNRICEQRLSPLYISVHATEPDVRAKLLGNRACPPILELLEELASHGITMHAQVVLCPGMNDGPHFERTVRDLAALYPHVASLAVVPVGLTRYRDCLPRLLPVTPGYAAQFLDQWRPLSRNLSERLGEPFLFFADEFFIKAGRPFPLSDEYGDFPQVENGVGMVPLFTEEAHEIIADAKPLKKGTVAIVTGESPYPYLRNFFRQLAAKTGMVFRVLPVKNTLFGDSVTVTGLVPGRAVMEMGAGGRVSGVDLVVIPDVMIKDGEGLFIDDVTVDELHNALGVEVVVCEATPFGVYSFLESRFSR